MQTPQPPQEKYAPLSFEGSLPSAPFLEQPVQYSELLVSTTDYLHPPTHEACDNSQPEPSPDKNKHPLGMPTYILLGWRTHLISQL